MLLFTDMSDSSLKLGLKLTSMKCKTDEKHKKYSLKLYQKDFLNLKNLEVQAAFITPSKHDHRRIFSKHKMP